MTTPDDADTELDSAHPKTASLVFDEQSQAHSVIEDVLGLLSGTFAVALGLSLLRAAGAVTGGTAGLALLVDYASPWPFWLIYALINLPFAALAIWKKGWSFTIRTALSIGLVSTFSALNPQLLPVGEVQPIYATLAGNLLCGIGMLILFRHRSSLGGVTIIALVVQDRTGFRAGWTMMIFDVLIVTAALLVVPWQSVLISAAGVVLLNLVLALNHRPGRYIGH